MKLLEGIRVVDVTNVISGPMASYFFAILGAEVIKIEIPGTGDLSRKMGTTKENAHQKMGPVFLAMNAGKLAITLDLKSSEGKSIFRKLCSESDVVIENFMPGTMDRLGLGWESLSKDFPHLIYCAISGFGRTGDLSQRPSYDQIVQGYCGLMNQTGEPGGGPTRAGFVVCDTTAAMTAAFGVAAAIVGRQRSGHGELIDVSMLDVALSTLASVNVSTFLNTGREIPRTGNHSQTAAPSGTFSTSEVLALHRRQSLRIAQACRR